MGQVLLDCIESNKLFETGKYVIKTKQYNYTGCFTKSVLKRIGQKASRDLGHAAKFLCDWDILIFGFLNHQNNVFHFNFQIKGENTKENILEISFQFYICSYL